MKSTKPEIICIDCTDDDEENTPPNLQHATLAASARAQAGERHPSTVDGDVATVLVCGDGTRPPPPREQTAQKAVTPDSPPPLDQVTQKIVTPDSPSPETAVAETAAGETREQNTDDADIGDADSGVGIELCPPAPPPLLIRRSTSASPSKSTPAQAADCGYPLGIPFSTSFSITRSRRDCGRPLKQLHLAAPPATKKRRSGDNRQVASTGSRRSRQTRLATMQVRSLFARDRVPVDRTITRPPPLRGSRSTKPMTLAPHTHFTSGGVEEKLVPVRMPYGLVPLGDQYNPHGIQFQNVPPERMCDCVHPCRVDTCINARSYMFCDVYCCPFSGLCGNGLEPSRDLALMRNETTTEFTVAATHTIDANVVVGEYLGKMTLETMKAGDRPKNKGYRFYMHQDPDHPAGTRICIDALKYSNLLRFVNHSCFPNARFRQVHNGDLHTVVIVTNRRLERSDELLVDYGDNLWFMCRCGGEDCRRFFADGGDADDEMGGERYHGGDDEEKPAVPGELEDCYSSDFE